VFLHCSIGKLVSFPDKPDIPYADDVVKPDKKDAAEDVVKPDKKHAAEDIVQPDKKKDVVKLDKNVTPMDITLYKKGIVCLQQAKDLVVTNKKKSRDAYRNALEYFKSSIENAEGNDKAYYRIGQLYEHGNGCTKNTRTAMKYFKTGMDKGCMHSSFCWSMNVLQCGNKSVADHLLALFGTHNNEAMIETAFEKLMIIVNLNVEDFALRSATVGYAKSHERYGADHKITVFFFEAMTRFASVNMNSAEDALNAMNLNTNA
jgi:TPR repeat protein